MQASILAALHCLVLAVASQAQTDISEVASSAQSACLLQQDSRHLQGVALSQEPGEEKGDDEKEGADKAEEKKDEKKEDKKEEKKDESADDEKKDEKGDDEKGDESAETKDGEKEKESGKSPFDEKDEKEDGKKAEKKDEKENGKEDEKENGKEDGKKAEKKESKPTMSRRLELSLKAPLKELVADQGPLPKFLADLKDELVKAADISAGRLDMLGVRGDYLSASGSLLSNAAIMFKEALVLRQGFAALSSRDGGTIVDMEVLPGAGPSPVSVYTKLKERIENTDSDLMKGYFKDVLKGAELQMAPGVEGLEPRPSATCRPRMPLFVLLVAILPVVDALTGAFGSLAC